MYVAVKTLAAIDAAMRADNGNAYRAHLQRLLPLSDDAYRQDEDDFRSHLGVSMIGRECDRELWLKFHWASTKKFEPRMLRLFNRGHLEEPRLVAALLCIPGVQLWNLTPDGQQYRLEHHGGHFGSAIDGVGLGIPDMPDVPMICEFKTHNDKSFVKLVEQGVLKAKWEHFVQMQIYMAKFGLTHALYMSVNKNDDDLHAEIVTFDPGIAQRYMDDRAARIIYGPDAPKKLNESPGWFKCKFCDEHALCHSNKAALKNCRTCHHSRPGADGTWSCALTGVVLDKAAQKAGCSDHAFRNGLRG